MIFKYKLYDTQTNEPIPPELGQCYADDNTVTFGGYLGALQAEGRLEFRLNTPDLTELKQDKTNKINLACQQEIIGGFISSALGEPHKYDSDIIDQLNFMQAYAIAKIKSQPVPYRIWSNDGTKQFYPHTAEQFEIAYQDGAIIKAQALQKCATLKAQIELATTQEELEAIVW